MTMAFHALYDGVPRDPHDPKDADDDKNYIFNTRKEAFDKMKQVKNSRVKSCYTYDEALQFVRYGLERPLTEASPTVQTPEKSLHSGPKSQDLVLFRKNIETGNIEKVIETIWKNPRYLIGAGDTPTILKESFRYNAMHVAALSKSGEMCDVILRAVANPDFIEFLHGRYTEVCKDISAILLDLFLNTPEKGRNETPLHLASKYGALSVVKVLTSYPQCIDSPNKDGLKAKDIICERDNSRNDKLIRQIEDMMRERFYVPVIRSVDNSIPPIIGEPFSTSNPPNLCFDPLSPEMEIQAYAGPMNKEQAHGFRRRWKTPPRISSPKLRTSPGSPHGSSPLQLPRFEPNTSTSTPKTVERRGGRQLFPTKISVQQLFPSPDDEDNKNDLEAAVLNLNLNGDPSPPAGVIENTIPLTDTTNIKPIQTHRFALPTTTPFKLYRDLHSRLKDNVNDSLNSSTNSDNSTMFDSPMYKERHMKLSDTEKGLELVGRELAKEQNVKWTEHWPFLDEFIDIGSFDGLHKLEHHFKKRADKTDNLTHSPIHNLCENLEKFHVKDKRAVLATPKVSMPVPLPNVGTPSSAYLCAEKSWQVYAKRMAKPIVVYLDSVVQINDTLKAELKRLQSLICSYKEDLRFWSVNFQAAHSRFAHLIVYYISQERDCDISVITDKITQIQQSTQKHVINGDLKAEFISANLQLQCLLSCMLKYLNDPASTLCPEVLTTEQDAAEIWKSEYKCNCAWLLEKPDSRIKRLSRRHKDRVEAAAVSEIIATDALNDWQSSIISASSSDDDEFLSDSGSENDEYFTPPESPSQCGTPKLKDYNLYVLGDGPTKTDVDVLNALTGIEIDRATFPYVFNWKAAMLEHPIEERKNFPVPTSVNPTKYRSAESRAKLMDGLPIKCVIGTPHRLPRSPVKKISNMLRPTAFQTNRLKVQAKSETVQATEAVIVAKSPLFYCPVIKTDPAAQTTNGSTNSDIAVTPIPSQALEEDVKSVVSVTVISSGQNLVLRTDTSLDVELVSNVFVNSKDPPDEFENTGAQDVHAA